MISRHFPIETINQSVECERSFVTATRLHWHSCVILPSFTSAFAHIPQWSLFRGQPSHISTTIAYTRYCTIVLYSRTSESVRLSLAAALSQIEVSRHFSYSPDLILAMCLVRFVHATPFSPARLWMANIMIWREMRARRAHSESPCTLSGNRAEILEIRK